MKYKIEETCSCGALLKYEEDVEKSYLGKTEERQKDFHKAHKSCREIQIAGLEKLKEKMKNTLIKLNA
jgi:hypothetical protein